MNLADIDKKQAHATVTAIENPRYEQTQEKCSGVMYVTRMHMELKGGILSEDNLASNGA